mgnify:CR=1 FL=1
MVKITFEEDIQQQPPTSASSAGAVEVSASAAARIAEILARKQRRAAETSETPPEYLRVRVDGGGCNGYSYKFLFDDTQNPDDIAIDKDGVTVLIDAVSYNYLQGSVIDFVESLEASQFTINNPNATSQCGCGNSFGL